MGKFYQAESAVVLGNVTIGTEVGIWHNAVVRGDMAPISIGAQTNVQDGCVLHVDTGFPLTIGERCTIGHGVILHGCTLEDEVLLGMGAIVMNGARIGKGSLIGAGALVLEGAEIPPGSVVLGSPAKVRGEVNEAQALDMARGADFYVEEAKTALPAKELPVG